jgi:hypothetical protein
MYIRVTATVLGEKLGVACASHSCMRAATVPLPFDPTARWSASAPMAAKTLEASRLFPRTVRSSEILRPVSGSRPA